MTFDPVTRKTYTQTLGEKERERGREADRERQLQYTALILARSVNILTRRRAHIISLPRRGREEGQTLDCFPG